MALRLNGSTSGYTEIDAPAAAGNNKLTLPTGNGSNRQQLMSDGAGALSWQWAAGSLFYRLNADLAGANVGTPQNIFGVGVALAASTVYQFEGLYIFTKTAGTTSHNFRIGFSAGTATVNNIAFSAQAVTGNTALAVSDTALDGVANNSSGNTVIVSGITAATYSIGITIRGTVSINAAGTFIPTYDLTSVPGGAYSTVAGSYIAFAPIGAAGSASSQGTWS